MADEIIVIEIQDKIPQIIVDKLKAIAIYSNYAAGAIDKLDAASLKAALGNERLAQAQAKSALAAERLFAAEARSSTELEKLTAASITAGIAQERLSQAKIKTATANETLALAQNRALISAEQLKQAEIKTKIAVEALSIAQAKLTNEQTKASISNQKLKTEVVKTATSSQNLSAAIDRTSLAHLRLTTAQNKLVANNQRVQTSNSSLSTSFASMQTKLIGAVGTYISVREVIELGNAYVGLQNKLKVVTSSESQLTEVSSRLFDIANKTRGPIEETAAAFSRFDLALKPLGKSQEEVLRMTETINKAMVVSGATAGEQAAGLLQLSQAFNKGKLDGDEFRSVMELMPSVADAIAKQMKVTRGELLLLAPQGKITADILAKALAGAADEIDKKFAKTVPTLAQAMTVLRNNAVLAMGDFEKGAGGLEATARAITGISKSIEENTIQIQAFGAASKNLAISTGSIFEVLGKAIGITTAEASAMSTLTFMTDGLAFSLAAMSDGLRLSTSLFTLQANLLNGVSLKQAYAEFKDSITLTNGAMQKMAERSAETDKKLAEESGRRKIIADLQTMQNEYDNLANSIEKSKANKETVFKWDLIALDDMGKKITELDKKKVDLFGGTLRPAGPSNAPKVKIDAATVKNELTRSQTLAKINAELDKEAGTLQRLSPEREIYNRYSEIEIQLANKKLAGNKIGIKAAQEELDGIKAKITANEQEKKVAEERNKIYSESIAPAQNYNNTVAAASQLLAKNLITQDEYNKRLLIANETYASLTNPMADFNKQIEQEGYLLNFSGMQLEVENRLMQLRNELVSNGVKDVEVSLLLERKTIEALVLKNRVTQESQSLMRSLGMTVEEFKIKQLGLNEAMAKVSDPGQKAALTVAAFSDVLSATQLGLDAELAMYKKHQEEIDKLQKDGVITKKVAKQAEFNLSETYNEKERAKKIQFLSNMASLANSSNRELFEIGKAAAVAQATYEGYLAVQKALSATGNTLVNIALAASVGVMTANNIAGIMNTKMAGYEKGGLVTGGEQTIRINERGQEFVMNAASTAKHRPILEAMNRGGSVSSVGKGSAQILIQNFGTSKTFEVEQLDENKYRIIARDEARDAIRNQVPGLVASEIGNPNSRTSKSLSQHTTAGRRV